MTAWTGPRTRTARAVVERLLRRVRGGTVAVTTPPAGGARRSFGDDAAREQPT